MKDKIQNLIKDGFLHIVGAGTINKVISLCSGIIIVRLLSKSEYGVYSYVMNIVNMVLLTNGLGSITAMMQFGCEYRQNEKKQRNIIQYGTRLGLSFNCVLAGVIIVYGLCVPQKIKNTEVLFISAAFIPIFTFINESFTTVLRVKENNRLYSYYSVVNSTITLTCILIGARVLSVLGAITFRYFSWTVLIIVALLRISPIRDCYIAKEADVITQNDKREFINFSFISCANNSIAHMFYNVDLFIIGVIIAKETTIAAYKVASTIPLALTFLTTSIITYVYPKFVRNQTNYSWLKTNYVKLTGLIAAMNAAIALFLFIGAPFFIKIVFGQQYVEDATSIFRILLVGFFISASFRMPAGNILDMLHLVKPNFIISIICGLANIVMDVILIKQYSAIGAAIATSCTYALYGILSNCIIMGYIHKLRNV